MYKVFFFQKTLILAGATMKVFPGKGDAVYDMRNRYDLEKSVIEFMNSPNLRRAIFFHPNIRWLKREFFGLFYPVKAAGGIVEDRSGRFLFIYRHKTWDLPKGKVDRGERVKDAAVREVEEETGVTRLEIKQLIKPTYHIYQRKGRFNLKTTYWYHMTTDGKGTLKPQTEEGIEQVIWAEPHELIDYAKQSYKSIEALFHYFNKFVLNK